MEIWGNTPRVRMAAVCDIDPVRAQEAAEKYGAQAFTDLTEMIKNGGIDAVDICTPSGLHAQMGIEAMQAGKHVLTEKPFDIDIEKVDKLIALADKTGLKLACIFQYRFSPEVQKAHQLIQDGKLGKIISCSTYAKWYRSQEYYETADWRGTWALDGGVLSNQAIHNIDQLTWMAGPVAEVEYAHLDTVERKVEVETFATVVVRFESGALGVIEATTNCYPGMDSRTQIFGTKGSAEFDGNKVLKFKIEGEEIDLASELAQETDGRADPKAIPLMGHARQMLNFVDAVLDNTPLLCDGRSARVPVDCLTKIYRKAGITAKLGT